MKKNILAMTAALFLSGILYSVPAQANCPTCQCIVSRVTAHTPKRKESYRTDFIMGRFFNHVLTDLRTMADERDSVKVAQNQAVGGIMDGVNTQRTIKTLQTKKTENVNNNRPSDQVCTVGSVSQGALAGQINAKHVAATYNAQTRDEGVGKQGMSGDEGPGEYKRDLVANLMTQNISPADENGAASVLAADDVKDANASADMPTASMFPGARELNAEGAPTDDGMNLTNSKKLIFREPPTTVPANALRDPGGQDRFVQTQSVLAKRNYLSGSWDTMMSQHAQGTGSNTDFMAAQLEQEGFSQDMITGMYGEKNSQDAMLSALTFYGPQSTEGKLATITTEDDVDRQILQGDQIATMNDRKTQELLADGSIKRAIYLNLINKERIGEITNLQGRTGGSSATQRVPN